MNARNAIGMDPATEAVMTFGLEELSHFASAEDRKAIVEQLTIEQLRWLALNGASRIAEMREWIATADEEIDNLGADLKDAERDGRV